MAGLINIHSNKITVSFVYIYINNLYTLYTHILLNKSSLYFIPNINRNIEQFRSILG